MDGQHAGNSLVGAGLGLRSVHIGQVLSEHPAIPWFEVLADNHTARGGMVPQQLAAVRADYPITFHCVGMSIGGTEPLDFDYLRTIKRLINTYEPALVSDHLCFSNHAGHQSHDLLPVPYTDEALRHISARICQIQDFLGIRLLVENVSTYLSYKQSTLAEPEFIAAMAEAADCDLIFDINNSYVNEVNHGARARDFLQHLPLHRIREIHLAGYEDKGDYVIDAHNNPVSDSVWDLLSDVIPYLPDVPILIEWDNDIPSLEVLVGEAHKAERIRTQCNVAAA